VKTMKVVKFVLELRFNDIMLVRTPG